MSIRFITLHKHIRNQQKHFPGARGEFSGLLYQLAFAAKIVSREINKAGLVNVLGFTDSPEENVQGEQVKKLDTYANDIFIRALDYSGFVCGMVSEENKEIITIPNDLDRGQYVIAFDPLDGSSNIDNNINIGTIFAVHRKVSPGRQATTGDFLQMGHNLVAAGYILYGSSTMLVYSSGLGVHGFTLDQSIGEFLLSHENIRIPQRGATYSANEGNYVHWSTGIKRYIKYLQELDSLTNRPYKLRYVGSLVADIHRTLLTGGIFMYPADTSDPKKPTGKLRLLYEAQPMAYLVENAGGMATTGTQRVLDIVPREIHQRVPLILGSDLDIQKALEFLAEDTQ